jgi:hypothetical protein
MTVKPPARPLFRLRSIIWPNVSIRLSIVDWRAAKILKTPGVTAIETEPAFEVAGPFWINICPVAAERRPRPTFGALALGRTGLAFAIGISFHGQDADRA